MQRNKADDFLKLYGMHYEDINPLECIEGFISEMKKGLEKESSLEMLPAYISPDDFDYSNKKAVAIDAGGTHLRISLISFGKNRNYNIEYLRKYPMPGIYESVNAEEFFLSLAEKIAPLAAEADDIGFSFSYPAEILQNKDGRIKYFTKDLKVLGANGLFLGENLNAALKKTGVEKYKNIVVLNDTVAAMLGGKAAYRQKSYGGYIGFILGTGINTCYAENINNIKKIDMAGIQKNTMIVNIESGGFANAVRGIFDLEFDKTTADCGMRKMEKMISGAYLGGLNLTVFKAAAKDKIINGQTAENILSCNELTTTDLSAFMDEPDGQNIIACLSVNPEDKETLCRITEVLIERASVYAAVILAASVKKSCKVNNEPLCITAEGTTFYDCIGMKDKINYYLKRFLKPLNLKAEIVHAENAAITGAAIAALMN